MRKRMIVLFLIAVLLCCAFTPGGRGRIPVPPQYVTATAQDTEYQAAAPVRHMPPRLRGTAVPPFCNQPNGPRC